jgi:hypothetical protein
LLRLYKAAFFDYWHASHSIYTGLPETFSDLCDDALKHSEAENSEKQTCELRLHIDQFRPVFGSRPAESIPSWTGWMSRQRSANGWPPPNTGGKMNIRHDKSNFSMPMFMLMNTRCRDPGYSVKLDLFLTDRHTLRLGYELHRFVFDD